MPQGTYRPEPGRAPIVAVEFPIEISETVPPWFDGGYAYADLIDPQTTAVIAFTDTQAAGVIARLAEFGRRVPDDVSVIGSNDIPIAAMYSPSLTTMRTRSTPWAGPP